MSFMRLESAVSRVVSPNDTLYPIYEKQYAPEVYFQSGLYQMDALEALLRRHSNRGLEDLTAIADFACHYGRLLRAFRVAAPVASLYAYDISDDVIEFCARELGCVAAKTDWEPEKVVVPAPCDLVICISLLTHTKRDFLPRVLSLWNRMLKPGGMLCFTYLGDGFMTEWAENRMAHYCPLDRPPTAEQKAKVLSDFARDRHAFHGYATDYSEGDYGVGFHSEDIIRADLAAFPDLEFRETLHGPNNAFGQDLAVVTKKA